ncbi:MAG: hypothetical protein MRQ07_03175 [Candidatus Midichloria sp.]|nr:hypothetical protein [Candidatus Midichloria sp.]
MLQKSSIKQNILVCHKDIDEIHRLCDGMLMSTVLSDITGGIAYSIISPTLYNNEDVYENKSIFIVIARSLDFWDGFRISAAYNIITELAPKGMSYLDTYITNILSIAVELLGEAYKYNGEYTQYENQEMDFYSEGELGSIPARLHFEL